MIFQRVVALVAVIVECVYTFSVADNNFLPPLYEMDDYSLCQKENGLYCKVILQVVPNNTDNAFWNIIEKRKENPFLYHRDVVYRYKCIPLNFQNKEKITQTIIKQENEKLKNVSLTVQIKDLRCRKFENISLSSEDKIFLYILFMYIVFVTAATFYDIQRHNGDQPPINKVKQYFLFFSIKSCWKSFLQHPKYPDYVHLRSFQCLKSVGMLLVVCGHTIKVLMSISVSNPEIIENIFDLMLSRIVFTFGLHFIQVFFLISGWLVANGLASTFFGKNAQKFRARTLLSIILVRYCRLIVPLALVVAFSRTSLFKLFERGPQGDNIYNNHQLCKNHAWATMFFVNNHYYLSEQCYLITWYLSADFQFYVATLILVYIALKYKLKVLRMLLLVFMIDWIYNAFVIYKNRLPPSSETTAEISRSEITMSLYQTFALHSSPYINIGGYIVGITAGVLYHEFKNKDLKCAKMLLKMSLITPSIVLISIFNYSPMINGIIGSSVKPLFNFGVACLVLGLIFSKENGVLKKFFEWKYFEYLSKISYSVYLSHYWISFGREMLYDKIIELSFLKLVICCLIDACLSLLLGFLVHILFESPFRSLLGALVNKNTKTSNMKTAKD